MSYVISKHIKGTDNILADSILHLRSIHFYYPLYLEGEGKEFGHDIFKEILPIITEGKEQVGKIEKFENHPHAHRRNSSSGRMNDTMVNEKQHVPLKFDPEERRKLQEKYPNYAKLTENMNLKK